MAEEKTEDTTKKTSSVSKAKADKAAQAKADKEAKEAQAKAAKEEKEAKEAEEKAAKERAEAEKAAADAKKAEDKAEKAATKAEKPSEQRLRLQDASKRFCQDYRDHWWPSIQRFAATQNFTEPATIPQCKELLRRWGAKLK